MVARQVIVSSLVATALTVSLTIGIARYAPRIGAVPAEPLTNPKITLLHIANGIYRFDDPERGAACYFRPNQGTPSCITQMRVELRPGPGIPAIPIQPQNQPALPGPPANWN